MKVIRKYPGKAPEIIHVTGEDQLYSELGEKAVKVDLASDLALVYDGAWRENGKPVNTVLCGMNVGGPVFLVGISANGLKDVPNADGVLYTFYLHVRYGCVDKENNVWKCRHCGYLHQFEADGPYENGWNVCPSCGGQLTRPFNEEGKYDAFCGSAE